MLLILVAGVQSVKAQTYNLLPAASTSGTVAGTTYTRVMSGNNTSGCVGKTTGIGSGGTNASGTCTVNFTGGNPVFYIDLALDGSDYQNAPLIYNRETITVNGVTHTPSAANFICNGGSCTNATLFSSACYSVSTSNYTISGNYLQAASGGTTQVGRCIYRVSSSVPITQIAITEDQVGTSGGAALGVYIITGLPVPCIAGTTAPSLSATTIANVCPATTVDLTTITASNLPSFTSLTWHTATPATTANKITGTAVAAGTYYAAFFDATANCYSGTGGNGSATTSVTASVNSCTAIGAGTIQCSQTQIIPAPAAGTPGQVVLVASVNVSAAGCFPLTVSGSGLSLANSVTNACTSTTGVQNFYIPLNYDGSTLGTLNFTVGAAGSCTADLTLPSTAAVTNIWTLDCVPSAGPTLH